MNSVSFHCLIDYFLNKQRSRLLTIISICTELSVINYILNVKPDDANLLNFRYYRLFLVTMFVELNTL